MYHVFTSMYFNHLKSNCSDADEKFIYEAEISEGFYYSEDFNRRCLGLNYH